MSYFLARSLPILLSMTLMLRLGDCTVQAQSPPQTETNAETSPNSDQPSPSPSVTPSNEAPADETQPRRLRRHIGIGGSIGVSGEDTGLSEGGFAIVTRNDLSDSLSIRSANVFGSNRTDRTIALTVNLPVQSSSGQVKLIPFIGGGVLISSKSFFEDVIVRGLVTGGIDLPISRRFTATTSVTVGFTDTANVGVQLGVMYGF